MSSVIPLQRNKQAGSAPTTGPGEAVPMLTTKITPPVPRASRIPRVRLEGLLAEAAERKLTILRAPGGFGKTTLALSWIEKLHSRGDAVAWLSIDDNDNEPRQFIYYVIQALHRACPDIGKESLKAANSATLHQLQALLANEITDCGDELFLFLDDYNAVSHEAIHGFISFLLRHAPANLRLVLLSRSEPPLELGALRARGELLEVDAARLRFTGDETRDFLGITAPSGLSLEEVQTIHRLTEGWPAALRITALSFGAGRDPAELLRSLTRSPRSIGGFLDELCSSLPADLLEFMERTAIVDRLSSSLCEAITGRADSDDMLDRLDRQQLVNRLDDDGDTFACHQLFRDYLLQRLERHHGNDVAELHRRASRWYEACGLEMGTVKHLLAAGDTEAALVRITQCAGRMVETGDLLTLLNWERQLRSKSIEQPITLQLAIIWAEALSLSSAEAVQHIAAVEHAVEQSDAGDAAAVRRECIALRAVASGLADDPTEAIGWVTRYAAHAGDPPLALGSVNNVARFVHLWNARWSDFHAVPPIASHDLAEILPATYEAYLHGVAELSQARAGPAEQRFLQSLEVGRRARRFAGATGMAKGPYAELLYETGRTNEAEALLRDEIDLVANGVALDTALRGLLTAARLASRRGQPEQAGSLLERAEVVGLTREWPRLVAGALYQRLRLQQQQGSTTAALGLLKRLQQLHDNGSCPVSRGIEGVSHYHAMGQAVVCLEQQRPQHAIAILAPVFANATTCGASLIAIRVGALVSRAHLQARAVPQALRVFNQVLDLAAPSSLVGSIADEGAEIVEMLDLLKGTGGQPDSEDRQRFIQRLRESVTETAAGISGAAPRTARDLSSPLSPRECEILGLIAEGQSNKAIARQLGLGPETIKSHLKNIFVKLEVDRRTQAVLRADELGVLRIRRSLR